MYSLSSKSRGDFAAEILQLTFLRTSKLFSWNLYCLPESSRDYFEQMLHREQFLQSQFSVSKCRTFYWKRLNYLLGINYPANVAFFALFASWDLILDPINAFVIQKSFPIKWNILLCNLSAGCLWWRASHLHSTWHNYCIIQLTEQGCKCISQGTYLNMAKLTELRPLVQKEISLTTSEVGSFFKCFNEHHNIWNGISCCWMTTSQLDYKDTSFVLTNSSLPQLPHSSASASEAWWGTHWKCILRGR